MTTIEFVHEKVDADKLIKQTLETNGILISKEYDINKGLGTKITCQDGSCFILYFKNNKSSKIVFEKYSEELLRLFTATPEEKIERIPVHASFSIHKQNLQKIKDEIQSTFETTEQEPNTLTIEYILKITRGTSALTISQFKTGKILLQGVSSPLVSDVKAIINKFDKISDKEEALTYIPEENKKEVEQIMDALDNKFSVYCVNARNRLSTDAFNYLYLHDKEQIVSALGLLDVLKDAKKDLPLFNPIIYPISIAFEGFLVKMLLERNVVSQEDYQKSPDKLKIGEWLRKKNFERYIKDKTRNSNILDELNSCWEGVRCHELHSDPMQNMGLKKLINIEQAEDLIGRVFNCIRNAYQIIVKDGYSEEEMVSNKKEKQVVPLQGTINNSSREIKEIPSFECHIGTDESGKGDYFGPLVIAGVFVTKKDEVLLKSLGIKDSKENSDTRNNELAKSIYNVLGNEKISVVAIGPEKYNELYNSMGNLNNILGWGHARAIENLLEANDCENAIADQFGNESTINDALMKKGKQLQLLQTPKAERDIGVAAASILARSRFLQEINKLSYALGFTLSKGANAQVEEQARQIIKNKGKSALSGYAKLHFKTTNKL